jgi:hypothetical protein
MSTVVETIEHAGQSIEISYDECEYSPRENDNICIIHIGHSRYSFGDENHNDAESIHAAEREAIAKGDLVYPLYMLDHGGITLSLTPFSCPWDSGQVGFVQVRKSEIMANWGKKNWTKKLRDKAYEVAGQEVTEMDNYVRGEVYCYSINDGEETCGGYIGEVKYCIDEAKSMAEHIKQHKEEKAEAARIAAPLPLFPEGTEVLS